MKKFFLFLAAFALAASCQNESVDLGENEDNNENGSGNGNGNSGETTSVVITFDGSELPTTYPTDETISVNDFDFVINSVANFTESYESNGPIQFKASESYLYNITAFEDATSIAITLAPAGTSYNNFEVYAGESEKPSGTALTPAKDGDVVTYALPEGTTHIAITNTSTYTAYAFEIEITCGDGEAPEDEEEDNNGGTTTPDPDYDGATSYSFTFTSVAEEAVSSDATYTDQDIEFVVNNTYYSSYYGNTTTEEGGYFYNTTPLYDALTELVIEYTSSNTAYQTAQVYVGESENPTTLLSSSSTSSYTVTYTLPEGSTYFKIVSPSGYIRFYSIDFNSETSSGGDSDYEPSLPQGSGETRYAGWAELPTEDDSMTGDYYYAYHMRSDATSVRNYAVCYSKEYMCPVWVASPMHSCYQGSASRTDAYSDDPDIPFTEAGKWDGYTRGHMLGSSDRLVSTATNKQVFYHSNIAPQLGYVNGGGFNTGGGVWNNLEEYTDGQWCSDTLYLVNGAYWENTKTVVDDTVIPTHYYKVMLRTKSGNSGKAVWDCTSDELKCVVE